MAMANTPDKMAVDETMMHNDPNIPTNPTEPENRGSTASPINTTIGNEYPYHPLSDNSTTTFGNGYPDPLFARTRHMNYQYLLNYQNYVYSTNFLPANSTTTTRPHYNYRAQSFGNPGDAMSSIDEEASSTNELDMKEKVNLREWLELEGSSASKADRLGLFRQVVRLVDDQHRQGFGLMDLMPSSFELYENWEVKYVGRISCDELFIEAEDGSNVRKRGSAGEGEGCGKARKVGEEGRSVMVSEGAEMEKNWYALPEGFDDKDLPYFNVYCLGLLLFEFMSRFERKRDRNAAMVDLQQRFLSPEFRIHCPKEAGVCFWLLNPEPSSRPTTREILEHELLYELESTNPRLVRRHGS